MYFYIRLIMIMIIKHPWYLFMISRTGSVISLYEESFHTPRHTIPETNSKSPWKSMVGRWISFQDCLFSGDMLVSGMVFWAYIPWSPNRCDKLTEARLVTPQCLRWDSGDEWHKIEEDQRSPKRICGDPPGRYRKMSGTWRWSFVGWSGVFF